MTKYFGTVPKYEVVIYIRRQKMRWPILLNCTNILYILLNSLRGIVNRKKFNY